MNSLEISRLKDTYFRHKASKDINQQLAVYSTKRKNCVYSACLAQNPKNHVSSFHTNWNRTDASLPFAFFTDISWRVFMWWPRTWTLFVGPLWALWFWWRGFCSSTAAAARWAWGITVPPFPSKRKHVCYVLNTHTHTQKCVWRKLIPFLLPM